MHTPCLRSLVVALAASLLLIPSLTTHAAVPPNAVPGLNRTVDFFPGARYEPAVPTPEAVLGFPVGHRATTAGQIEACLRAWTEAAPDRTRLVEYARSHEGRPLYYVVVTAPANLARLDAIETGLTRLGDPRLSTEAEAEYLIGSLPAVAWLGYTIHGDETEGSDAALAVLYHLIASTDPDLAKLREDLVIIVDPLMNPDGRERFVKMIAEHRGTAPNVDDRALVHSGYWPYGRGNHYLFDLNRDWLWAVHPETRGRLRAVARWQPVLFVDAHGMGPQETHLFSPPREPINPNLPAGRATWNLRFAEDQARAFDQHGLVYYTGEWHEEWYPGYSDAYVSYRGAVGILYEQARVAEDGVRRADGRILSYAESVQHHVIGSFANLRTAQTNARALLRHLRTTRQEAVSAPGPYAGRTFAILPSANATRRRALIELALIHGFEVFESPAGFTAAQATNQLGQTVLATNLPPGTLLIPNRQPLGHLLAAAFEFDPRLSDQALDEERQELLRQGASRIYDTTAWNLTMFFGLDALTLAMELPEGAKPVTAVAAPEGGVVAATDAPVAWVVDGADDHVVTVTARLLERGVQVRVAERAFQLDGRDFARGAAVITRLDNRTFPGDCAAVVAEVVTSLGLTAVAVQSGLGPGELPDLGGRYFPRLEPPRIALLGRGRFDTTDFGSLWHTLDHRLGIRHSPVEDGGRVDLGRYNVLVLPNGWSGSGGLSLDALKEWVRDGGTLIAIGSAAGRFTTEAAGFSKVRLLPEVLGRLADYELTVLREWLGRGSNTVAASALWSYQPPAQLEYPWQAVGGGHPEEKELRKRDAWLGIFMPQGALMAGRVDTNSWLTFGCAEPLPLLADRRSVLMSLNDVETPIRYGYLTPTDAPATEALAKPGGTPAAPSESAEGSAAAAERAASGTGTEKKDKPEPARIGWTALPPGTEMHLRQSGLVWPEATHRIANTAYVTREGFGRGQIILFATSPTFRSAAQGTTRVFLNAVVYGPGLGATQSIKP
jgi:hypothetical protein